MGHQQEQANHAPAVSLDSADYLTNKKTIKEYEKIQVDHLRERSWLARMAENPSTRRFARDLLRFIMLLVALGVGIALIYMLEQDASLATGE